MIRKLYYFLPASLRYLVRRFIFFPQDLISSWNQKLIPPRGMIYTGSKDFIQQGKDWKELFIQYANLKPDHHVLDIGSGIGRIALGLTNYLEGNYEGFDVVKIGVHWCQKNISSQFPNFHFQFIDLFNDLYKSKGKPAADFAFPFASESFDFACAISVFTHMLPDELENYLNELRRVLKSNGHAVITFFILDNETSLAMNKMTDGIRFNYFPDERYALMDARVRSANVAYQRIYLNKLFSELKLNVVHEFQGRWPDRHTNHPLAFQDIIIVRKD